MPCPHNEITIVQRSQRQSAVAAAAYQSGEKLFCEYDQQVKHYPEKRGIVHNEILLPANAPPEYADRNTLWNAAEVVEKQWNSQLARRWVLTIPREIPPDQYAVLVREFCEQQFVSKGMIADFAIHDPHPPGHNPHAHVMLTMRAMYFERNGGYEYAKQFYEEAFHFIEEKFGADNIISAVMHADEINAAATEELGKEVYHYHLHAMVLPVVEKEILWSKRCKDEKLRGTVKEVVHQISHSKKWKSDIPLTDEKGNPLLRKNGKPMFRASYSILQDELFNYMTEQGFKGFQRGEYGSTAEHLTSLQYQIKQDKERLEKLQKRIQREQIKYEPARNVSKTYNEIDSMGQKTITGKMAISKEDYSQLTALAKEGITSRAEINELEQSANYYRQKYFDCANALERMKTKYNELKEKCRPFLQALEHFPEVAKLFTEKVKQLFSFKEAQERAEKEAREKERQERIKARKNKRGMER